MFNLGAGEILVIAVLALIVLGPERIPSAMRQMGRVMGEVRRVSNGFQAELRSALEEEELRASGPVGTAASEVREAAELPLQPVSDVAAADSTKAPEPPQAGAAPAGDPPTGDPPAAPEAPTST